MIRALIIPINQTTEAARSLFSLVYTSKT